MKNVESNSSNHENILKLSEWIIYWKNEHWLKKWKIHWNKWKKVEWTGFNRKIWWKNLFGKVIRDKNRWNEMNEIVEKMK